MQTFITCFAGETDAGSDDGRFVVVFAPFSPADMAAASGPCDDPMSFDSTLAPLVQECGCLEAHLRR